MNECLANSTTRRAGVRYLGAIGAALGVTVVLGVLDKMHPDWYALNGWLSQFPFGFCTKTFGELLLDYLFPMLAVYAGSLVLPGPLASPSYLIAAWGGKTLVQAAYMAWFRRPLPPTVMPGGVLPEYQYDEPLRWVALVFFALAMGALLKARKSQG